jgi:hypothetical protein
MISATISSRNSGPGVRSSICRIIYISFSLFLFGAFSTLDGKLDTLAQLPLPDCPRGLLPDHVFDSQNRLPKTSTTIW